MALAAAIVDYKGVRRPLFLWLFLALSAIGASLVVLRPTTMLYPDGGPSDAAVILWQMPQFAAAAVACGFLTASYLRENSPELRTEGLLLLLALLPYLSYTSATSFTVALLTPGPPEIWMWAYWTTFGASLAVVAVCVVVLWKDGEPLAKALGGLTVVVSLVGPLQAFLLTDFVLFGGALRILAALALAYGLLKYGLFGTDLHLKWGVDRGALLAVFGGVFFVVDQAAQYFVSSAFGAIAGFAAAILLLFALKPLQRWTARLADRVFPHVQRTQEYVDSRRLTVYRSAAQAAAKDGVITERERAMLTVLVRELELPNADVERVEREVLGSARAV